MVTITDAWNVLQSNLKLNELLFAVSGAKPVLRFVVASVQTDSYQKIFQGVGLNVAISEFALDIQTDQSTGFSNRGVLSALGGMKIIYAGKDAQRVDAAKEAEGKGDHVRLGQLLGYPVCCTHFFVKHREFQEQTNNDYILPLLQDSDHDNLQDTTYPWQNNVFARYGDFCLLSHFPCKLDCEESKQIAQRYLQVIENARPEYATQLKELLCYSALYTEKEGVYLLRNAKRNGDTITFDHVVGTLQDSLFKELDEAKSVHIGGKQTISIKRPRTGYVVMFA